MRHRRDRSISHIRRRVESKKIYSWPGIHYLPQRNSLSCQGRSLICHDTYKKRGGNSLSCQGRSLSCQGRSLSCHDIVAGIHYWSTKPRCRIFIFDFAKNFSGAKPSCRGPGRGSSIALNLDIGSRNVLEDQYLQIGLPQTVRHARPSAARRAP